MFSSPGFSLEYIGVDVLHAMDLGITQDIVGNTLWECLALFGGAREKRASKVAKMEAAMKDHNRLFKVVCVIDHLTEEMLWKKDTPSPKLRAKGGETRHVVPFVLILAKQLHAKQQTEHSHTVLKLMSLLMDLYMMFSHEPWDPDAAAQSCRRMLILYSALCEEAGGNERPKGMWRIKPKAHMVCEMLEYQSFYLGNPRFFGAIKTKISSDGVL